MKSYTRFAEGFAKAFVEGYIGGRSQFEEKLELLSTPEPSEELRGQLAQEGRELKEFGITRPICVPESLHLAMDLEEYLTGLYHAAGILPCESVKKHGKHFPQYCKDVRSEELSSTTGLEVLALLEAYRGSVESSAERSHGGGEREFFQAIEYLELAGREDLVKRFRQRMEFEIELLEESGRTRFKTYSIWGEK